MLLLFLYSIPLQGQEGFSMDAPKKTVIPFELINNLIFIPVTVNGVELTFLLDSGVNETLLFSLENKEVDFESVEKMRFQGLGGTTYIEGLLAINNIVKIGKHLSDFEHRIYLILNEDFNFSDHIGIPVNGIMGYQFFKNHLVEINYLTRKITVYNPSYVPKKLRSYQEIPLSLELNKPYITAGVQQTSDLKNSKLLIDLGNSDALWLFPSLIPGFQYNRPNIDDFLGRGFNGDIFGKRSRIHRLEIGEFELLYPLTAMPDEYSIQYLRLVEDRKGSIGSETLRRFSVFFDYPTSKIYLKRNRNFFDPFHFNMSGLDIKHDGMFWQKDLVRVESPKKSLTEGDVVYTARSDFQYRFVLKPEFSIAGSRPGSPAYEAGIRKGDKIVSINGKKASDFSLKKIIELLKSEEGKRITFEILRETEKKSFTFELQDPIPYQDP